MNNPQIDNLERAAAVLASLLDRFIFKGGATISLYIDEILWDEIRPTKDVDRVAIGYIKKPARSVANAHYTVDFFNTKGKKHIFEILSIYSFDSYLAGFLMYPVVTPRMRKSLTSYD